MAPFEYDFLGHDPRLRRDPQPARAAPRDDADQGQLGGLREVLARRRVRRLEAADSFQDYSDRSFIKQNFVRDGVIQGLAHEQSLGANPFKYGFVRTRTHNGTPSTED